MAKKKTQKAVFTLDVITHIGQTLLAVVLLRNTYLQAGGGTDNTIAPLLGAIDTNLPKYLEVVKGLPDWELASRYSYLLIPSLVFSILAGILLYKNSRKIMAILTMATWVFTFLLIVFSYTIGGTAHDILGSIFK